MKQKQMSCIRRTRRPEIELRTVVSRTDVSVAIEQFVESVEQVSPFRRREWPCQQQNDPILGLADRMRIRRVHDMLVCRKSLARLFHWETIINIQNSQRDG